MPANTSTNTKRITLGSGKLYCMDFDGDIPDKETLCVEANQLGYIKGGASLEYTPTFYEAKDDLGICTKTIITDEEAILKSGIMTFNANTLNKLSDTGRVTENVEKKTRTIKIGGIGNMRRAKYIIGFLHTDPVDGDVLVIIVGQNQTGFVLTFAKDAETVIDAEFKALAQDAEGTLIQYTEYDASITA